MSIRPRTLVPVLLVALTCAVVAAASTRAGRVHVLHSVAALPPHAAGVFREPLAAEQGRSGHYYVFDRRGHTVYRFDPKADLLETLVQIGQEKGRIIQPGAFSLGPDDSFVVADAPRGMERVQLFGPGGTLLGGFVLPAADRARLFLEGVVLNGIGSLHYTGETVLVSQPERGGLITEYDLTGLALRTFGLLRPTGHEHDPDLHLILNAGVPLAAPDGSTYFVFQTGQPMFRRYDREGRLLFERYIQGPELDDWLMAMPTIWPERTARAGGELPLVPPIVRTAAVDPQGRLWVAFTLPFTYVYDADGEKAHTVQFRAAGLIRPNSLSFTRRGTVLVTPGVYEFVPPGTDAAP